jgi:uncharacterized NAD(P)/FAD-binding protein YdhS
MRRDRLLASVGRGWICLVVAVVACGAAQPERASSSTAEPSPAYASPAITTCTIARVQSDATLAIRGEDIQGLCQSWLDVRLNGEAIYYLTRSGGGGGVVCHYISPTGPEYFVRAFSSGDWMGRHWCNWLSQWQSDPAHGQAPLAWRY